MIVKTSIQDLIVFFLTGKKLSFYEGYLNEREKPVSITLKEPQKQYDKVLNVEKEITGITYKNGVFSFVLKDYNEQIEFFIHQEFTIIA